MIGRRPAGRRAEGPRLPSTGPTSPPPPRGAWLLAILAIAAILQLPWLTYPWLHDGAALQAVSRDAIRGISGPFPMPYVTALYPALLGALIEVMGDTLLLPRLVSTASTLAAGVVVWAIGRRLAGEAGALVAAALYLLSPLTLSLPTVGALDDPLLFLVSLLLVLKGLEEQRARLLLCAGLVLGGSIYVRFFWAPLGPVIGLLILLLAAPGTRLRSFGAYVGGGALAALPMALLLLGTRAGREVLGFVESSASGRITMHTRLAEGLDTPLLGRLMETSYTVAGVALGRLDSGGLSQQAFPDVLGFGLVAAGLGWLAWRVLVRPDTATLGDRLLAGWVLGALLLLVFVFAWPAESGLREGLRYRAPRYAVLLFPAPWLAAGQLFERLWQAIAARRRALAAVLLPAVLLSAALPTLLAVQRVDVREPVREEVERLRAGGVAGVLLLGDTPVGRTSDWRDVRFPLDRVGLLELVGDDALALSDEPRVDLMLRHPQMTYGVQPPVYLLDFALGDEPVPGVLAPGRLPIPPLAPLAAAREQGEAWGLVVVLGSDRMHDTVPGRLAPGPPDARVGSPSDVASALGLIGAPFATGLLDGETAVAAWSIRLAERRWSSLDLRFGAGTEALADSEGRAWALPSTLYQPWLGYGFSHAAIDVPGEAAPTPLRRGLQPLLPVDFRVDVPPGLYTGVVSINRVCGARWGHISVEGQALSPPGSQPCDGGVDGVELPFEVAVERGSLELQVHPTGGDPGLWSLTGLRLSLQSTPRSP